MLLEQLGAFKGEPAAIAAVDPCTRGAPSGARARKNARERPTSALRAV